MGRICLALGAVLSLLAVPGASLAGEPPGWIVSCDYSHSLSDDPIVAPGKPGTSHLHDFLGNTSTNAFSTYSSMLASPTTCQEPADRAGYWVPSLFRNGVQVKPKAGIATPFAKTRERIYYVDTNLAAGTRVTSFPKDFRMIAGNPKATSTADNPRLGSYLYWGCSDNSTGKLKAPPSSCKSGAISLHVGFPNCWDGLHLDSADHKSHVVYPSDGKCPSGFPVALPRVIVRLEYPVGTVTGSITLSSGAAYTIHGDFWNTWKQPRLDQLVNDCLDKDLYCGLF